MATMSDRSTCLLQRTLHGTRNTACPMRTESNRADQDDRDDFHGPRDLGADHTGAVIIWRRSFIATGIGRYHEPGGRLGLFLHGDGRGCRLTSDEDG